MKTIFKILAILVVAVLIGGTFYGAVTASSGTDQASALERPDDHDDEFEPRDREEPDEGFMFPAESIKSLLMITVVGALYLNLPKLVGKRKPQPLAS